MKIKRVLKTYYLVLVLECFFLVGAVRWRSFSSQIDQDIFGLSPGIVDNLLLFLSLLITLLIILAGILLSRREGWEKRITEFLTVKDHFRYVTVFLWGMVLIWVQDLVYLYSKFTTPVHFQNYLLVLDWLLPLLVWGVVVFLETLVVLYVLYYRQVSQSHGNAFQGLWLPAVLALAALIAAYLLANLGLFRPSSAGLDSNQIERFIPLSRPITGLQLVIIWVVCSGLVWVYQRGQRRWPHLRKLLSSSFLLPALIWVGAVVSWISIPIDANYAVSITEEPTTAFYPASDAFYFDKEALRFTHGLGFEDTSTHVMYSFFLAGAHALVGEDYRSVIQVQFMVVALVPVLLYLLTKKLDSGFSGFLVSVLYIYRERNGMLLSGEVGGPVLNQLISENLALLGMVGFLSLVMLWVEEPEKNKHIPLLAGGLMGVSLLIRAEFLAVTLAVVAGTLLVFWHDKGRWLRGAAGMLLVVAVIITPWMYRNWQRTGQFSLDKGDFIARRAAVIVDSLTGSEKEIDLPDTSEGQPAGLMGGSFLPHAGNNLQQLVTYLPSNYQPLFVTLKAVSADVLENRTFDLNNLSEKYLYLYSRSSPYYWYDWDGRLSARTAIPGFFVFLLVILGFRQISYHHRRILWVFLLAALAHLLIWSLAGYSGSRYMKPVDWITLVLVGSGMNQLSALFLPWMPGEPDPEGVIAEQNGITDKGKKDKGQKYWQVGLLSVLILIGLGPSVAGNFIPDQLTREELEKVLQENPTVLEMVSGEGETVEYGVALYPQYFGKGEILPDHRQGTLPDPYGPRVDFYLIGTTNTWVSLPVKNADEVPFIKHGSTVIVTGREMKTSYLTPEQQQIHYYIEAAPIFLLAEQVIMSDSSNTWQSPEQILCSGPNCLHP